MVINIIQNLSTSHVRYFSFAFGVYRKNRSPSRGKIIAENSESRAGKLLGFPFTRYSVLLNTRLSAIQVPLKSRIPCRNGARIRSNGACLSQLSARRRNGCSAFFERFAIFRQFPDTRRGFVDAGKRLPTSSSFVRVRIARRRIRYVVHPSLCQRLRLGRYFRRRNVTQNIVRRYVNLPDIPSFDIEKASPLFTAYFLRRRCGGQRNFFGIHSAYVGSPVISSDMVIFCVDGNIVPDRHKHNREYRKRKRLYYRQSQ